MGIVAWRARRGAERERPVAETGLDHPQTTQRADGPVRDEAGPGAGPGKGEAAPTVTMTLDSLEADVAACQRCNLAPTRTRTVFGTGNPAADWMIVGEAPGAEEDRQGLPFVGRAGQLLNAMIASLGMGRDDVYIANVLKCRPPNNRDPLGEEVVQCLPYLRGQIRLVRPRIILALGRFAAQALLGTHEPIGKLRGRAHRYGEFDTPLVVSYHPAYLLRSPLEKRKAWQDLKLAMSIIDGSDR